MTDHYKTAISFLLGVAAALLVIGVMLLPKIAHGSTVCLTKKEARSLWPRQHIWWYSADHCWSNRRRGPPTGIKLDLIKNNHAESLPAPRDQNPVVKDASKADRINDPPTRRGTVRTIPIVKPTEWKNDFEDYCCWPQIELIDADGERERAMRILADKLRKKPLEQKQ